MLANTTRTLTEAQREQWAVDGYLQLEGALSPPEVEFFSKLLDDVRGKQGYEPAPGKLPRGHYAWKLPDQNLDAFMDRRDLLPYHQAFIDLIDRPRVFDLILDLMGPVHPVLDEPGDHPRLDRHVPRLHPHRRRRGAEEPSASPRPAGRWRSR